MKNYIIREWDGKDVLHLSETSVARLKLFKPKGCPFGDYSMLNLLIDFVHTYSWLITSRKEVSIADFIELVKTKDYKADVYGDTIISLLYEEEPKESESC